MKNSVLLLIALVACATTACSRRESVVAAGDRTQTLHVSIGGEPSELDPHVINAPPDFRVAYALFEGLLRAEPHTLEPQPGVAERWTISDDGRTYTFHLRANAKWSNGDPITSEDFLFAFRRALSPALGSQYTVLFSAVRGAEAFAAGKLTDFAAVGFAAPDSRTVVITLAQPTPYFLSIISMNPVWYPVHRGTIEKLGRADQRGTGWTRPEHFVGNGPFVLKEWRPNHGILVQKSPTYWEADRVRLQAIRFHPIDSVDSEERAFRAGQLHLTQSVPVARVAAYRAEKSPALVITPQLTARFITVNTTRSVLKDPRVRRALSLALDRRRFSERILHGTEGPAFNLVPEGTPGYRPDAVAAEDAELARTLLAEAGFPGGAGFPALTLARETGGAGEFHQAIQEAWRTQLGIHIAIAESESRTHWSTMQLKQYDLAVAGWNGDYADASSFLDLFVTGGGWNFTNWGDAGYDRLIAEAAGELNPEKRLKILQDAEAKLLEAMPIIPLTFARNRYLKAASVRDWPDNVLDRPDYRPVWLEAK